MDSVTKNNISNKVLRNHGDTESENPPQPPSTSNSRGLTNNSDLSSRISNTSKEDESRLGFTDHVHRKAVKKGFNFTIMVIGQSGLGKSTLVNSLFQQELYKDRQVISANQRISKTTKIEKRQIELDERGVKLRLTIVDTPGFGDSIDCTDSWKSIEDYIDGTFEQYFKDECGLNRKNIQDNRIHCCLYFVSPFGRGLSPLDLEIMRRLQKKVNIVPIIAKADTLTVNELKKFKHRLMENLTKYQIETYRLPECDSDEEDEIKKLDKEIKAVLPFAVIGSTINIENENGKKMRGRQYPWGTVEVDNSSHCDFAKLRLFLLKTHMQDLKDMTLEVHYENYRAEYITDRMSKRQNDRSKMNASSELSKYTSSHVNGSSSHINGNASLYKSTINTTTNNISSESNSNDIENNNGNYPKYTNGDQNVYFTKAALISKVQQMANRYQDYTSSNNNHKYDTNSLSGKESPQSSMKHQQAPPPVPGLTASRPVVAGN